MKNPYEARTSDEDEEGGEGVMMMKVVTTRVKMKPLVMMEMVRMIATMIVKARIVMTMIANIVVIIRMNSLVIEKMKM